MSAHDLATHGIASNTLIWHEGLPEWVRADSIEELRQYLSPANPATPPPVPGGTPTPPYINKCPQPSGPAPRLYNWTGWAIVATIFGCMIYLIGAAPGIIGIVYSSNARSLRLHLQQRHPHILSLIQPLKKSDVPDPNPAHHFFICIDYGSQYLWESRRISSGVIGRASILRHTYAI